MAIDERGRREAQRWQTPGDDPFEQWYWTVRRYYDRKVDPEIMELWRKKLRGIPVAELTTVFEDYIGDVTVSHRNPPTVDVILARWKARKNRQEALRAQKRRATQPEIPALTEAQKLRGHMSMLACFADVGMPFDESAYPDWMVAIARSNASDGKPPQEAMRLFDEEIKNHDLT